jgi:hypothetical protein
VVTHRRSHMRQKAVLAWFICYCLISGCGQPSQSQKQKHVARLPACFNVLESLQVTAYRNQDWCRNMAYRRGKFSSNNDRACNLFEGTAQAFDRQAQQDFDTVSRAIAATGVRLDLISDIKYGRNGKLKRAEFHLAKAGRHSYIYSPGYGKPPPNVRFERTYTPLNEDWYYIWEDWN